jgi:hypothetical protein
MVWIQENQVKMRLMKLQGSDVCCSVVGCDAVQYCSPEDGGDTFPRNFANHEKEYMTLLSDDRNRDFGRVLIYEHELKQ